MLAGKKGFKVVHFPAGSFHQGVITPAETSRAEAFLRVPSPAADYRDEAKLLYFSRLPFLAAANPIS